MLVASLRSNRAYSIYESDETPAEANQFVGLCCENLLRGRGYYFDKNGGLKILP